MRSNHPSDSHIDFVNLWKIVSSKFQLPTHSIHGPDHWKRVEENGLHLAQDNGADITVIRLFAVFHDSKRENEFADPDHGRRGAIYAGELRNIHFQITDAQFDLLETACTWHTETTHHQNPTIGACWDADRLDLGRVGIVPDSMYMNTILGRQLANEKAD